MEQVIKTQKTQLLFAQKEVMKSPTSQAAHIKWVWGLVCSGKVKQAIQAFDLLQKKKAAGLILDTGATDEYTKLQKIILAISGKAQPNPEDTSNLDHNLLHIAKLCQKSDLPEASVNPKEFNSGLINNIAVGLVKTILSTESTEQKSQLSAEIFYLLQTLVIQQGQLSTF